MTSHDRAARAAHLLTHACAYAIADAQANDPALTPDAYRQFVTERNSILDQIVTCFTDLGIAYHDRHEVRRHALAMARRGWVLPPDHLAGHTPYQLGECGDLAAIPLLIHYLDCGEVNERRLAASAVGKLAAINRAQASVAVEALLARLSDPSPQVRQYALKALHHLTVPEHAIPAIVHVYHTDEKDYNRDAAAVFLKRLGHAVPTLPHAPHVLTIPQLNTFLYAAFGDGHTIADLTRAAGTSAEAYARLEQQYAARVSDMIATQIAEYLYQVLAARTASIIVQQYGFAGHPPAPAAALSTAFDVSTEQLALIVQCGLNRVGAQPHRQHIAVLLVSTAHALLADDHPF